MLMNSWIQLYIADYNIALISSVITFVIPLWSKMPYPLGRSKIYLRIYRTWLVSQLSMQLQDIRYLTPQALLSLLAICSNGALIN